MITVRPRVADGPAGVHQGVFVGRDDASVSNT